MIGKGDVVMIRGTVAPTMTVEECGDMFVHVVYFWNNCLRRAAYRLDILEIL